MQRVRWTSDSPFRQKLPNAPDNVTSLRPETSTAHSRWLVVSSNPRRCLHLCGRTLVGRMWLASSMGNAFGLRETGRRPSSERAGQPLQSRQSLRCVHSLASAVDHHPAAPSGWGMVEPMNRAQTPSSPEFDSLSQVREAIAKSKLKNEPVSFNLQFADRTGLQVLPFLPRRGRGNQPRASSLCERRPGIGGSDELMCPEGAREVSAFHSPFRADILGVVVTQGGARRASLPWADFRRPRRGEEHDTCNPLESENLQFAIINSPFFDSLVRGETLAGAT